LDNELPSKMCKILSAIFWTLKVIPIRKGILNCILKSLIIRLFNGKDSQGLFSLINSRLNYSLYSFVKNWK